MRYLIDNRKFKKYLQQDKQIFACRLCSFSYVRSTLSDLLALVQFVPLHDHHRSEIVLLGIRHVCLSCHAVNCQSIFLLWDTQHSFGNYKEERKGRGFRELRSDRVWGR